jgi:outer membrane protein assembly factor BamB
MKNILSLLFCLVVSASAHSFEATWMSRVVHKHACLEALGAVVSSPKTCWSWSKREASEPFVDVASSQIFIGGTDGYLHVVEPVRGRVLKRKSLDGNLVSGIVAQGTNLILGTDKGQILAVDTATLAAKWTTDVDAGILETPVLVGDKVLFVTQLGTLYAINAQTGDKIWTKKRELPNRIFFRHLSLPVSVTTIVNGNLRDTLAIGHPNGKLEFLDVKNGEVLTDMQLGSLKEPWADVVTTPVFAEGLLFAASHNNGIVAFDASSRARKWELKEKGVTQLAYHKGILVMAGAKFVTAANAQTGKIIWRYRFNKGAPGTLLIQNGEVYVASDIDGLYVLDLLTGREKQILGSSLGFAGGVKNFDDDLLAMSSAGALFSFSR